MPLCYAHMSDEELREHIFNDLSTGEILEMTFEFLKGNTLEHCNQCNTTNINTNKTGTTN